MHIPVPLGGIPDTTNGCTFQALKTQSWGPGKMLMPVHSLLPPVAVSPGNDVATGAAISQLPCICRLWRRPIPEHLLALDRL